MKRTWNGVSIFVFKNKINILKAILFICKDIFKLKKLESISVDKGYKVYTFYQFIRFYTYVKKL